MRQRKRGSIVVKPIPHLSLEEVYPPVSLEVVYPPAGAKINFNTCGDPDCGNYGVAPDFSIPVFKGRNAAQRKLAASAGIPALASGLGNYKLNGDDKNKRISKVFEYLKDPREWEDGRQLVCQHRKRNRNCDVAFSLLSNEHFEDELDRLRTQSGKLEGPVCGHCGTRYLEHPEEFIFNGTHGKIAAGSNRRKAKPAAFRIIHAPCKGKPGARVSISLDHQNQKNQHDNVRLLRGLVNDASINALRRLLADPDTGKRCGVSRIYNRIFWLEKTLLAFEQAKLREWKAKQEASGQFNHTRVAHDDITISVNWESSDDRRLTGLQCSVSADIRSGYIFRIDANFDPQVDPVKFFEENYLDGNGTLTNIRNRYTQKSGRTFTAPKLHFQRPSGRYDEAALFASAESQWLVFSSRLLKAYETDPTNIVPIPAEITAQLQRSHSQRKILDDLRNGYFGFQETNRDFRGSFNGIMVKPTYTKAAHLACLQEMLPKGKITLVGEQEATMARVVPHLFRDKIRDDLFEWFIISFDKNATTTTTNRRIEIYEDQFAKFRQHAAQTMSELPSEFELLTLFCAQHLSVETGNDKHGNPAAFPIVNLASSQFPQTWVRSPAQIHGETQKVVGFPVLREKYRKQLKGLAFDQVPTDTELREALARRMTRATIQPVSSFMNALRHRLSPTERAGGRSARAGAKFITGVSFNPAVLIALLNIYRIHYNWFEPRQYTGNTATKSDTKDVKPGTSSIRIPGTNDTIGVPKQRQKAPIMRTPAQRLGADPIKDLSKTKRAPDPRRILYRPWLYHGTPLWKKFEER
ncbi:conserved hypothetical protein [Ruegeria lacuscaerulensis ITI-1157]|nr:conserved hypothetical protein [Ruegeria lacuscaerulensis ITI-1157]SHJ89356.1 hypothetical protein SAMN05444404_2894 [Ruegeria lacuscaerulensis ITI-1157]